MRAAAPLILLLPSAPLAAGHCALVIPPSRNAVDSDVLPWSGEVPGKIPGVSSPGGDWCLVGNGTSLSGANGQACFWFSNGCSIGCPECDGLTVGPSYTHAKTDICGGNYTATVCDPALRTVNTGAACGSAEDRWYYTPWRAPGSAPVLDPCGMAGGTPQASHSGAVYTATAHAKQGDLGSKTLPDRPSGTVWTTGATVEVSWAIQANHGGGYQYRLCPKSDPLTEACFQQTPLPFVGKQVLRWDGVGGLQEEINTTYISEGTVPPGSTWAMNPIPRNDGFTGQSFAPRCKEVPDCGPKDVQSRCRCSGMWGPFNLEIVNNVRVPADLPPGEYVLGWRMDCEESAQVWSSCADVTLVPPAPSPPPASYHCIHDACVEGAGDGLPRSECAAFCGHAA